MVCITTFKQYLSYISWRSVLLVEETGVPRENHWPTASHWQTLSHNIVSSTSHLSEIRTHNVNGDRHWLHRYLLIQLPYNHDGPKNIIQYILYIHLSHSGKYITLYKIKVSISTIIDKNRFFLLHYWNTNIFVAAFVIWNYN